MSTTNIVNEADVNGGQPSIKEGYTVLQIVRLNEAGFDQKEAAARLEVNPKSVDDALRYYENHQGEIEEIREKEEEAIEEFRVPNHEDSV